MTELKIFKAEDQRTTAIKELTGAIVGLFMGQEIDTNGHLSYILRVEEVKAAIQLAKKYQQLIEGKS